MGSIAPNPDINRSSSRGTDWESTPCLFYCQQMGILWLVVQFSHQVMSNSAIPWTAACQASLSLSNIQSVLKLMSITHAHDTIQPSHSQSSPSLPAFNLSQHQGLFSESVLHIRWSKYWSFSFSISPFNEYSGLTSFRMDWLDLFAVQGTLECLPQHHSSKASIL